MQSKSYKKLNSAFALEYVIVLMVFIIAVTAILLYYVNISASATKSYKNYVLQKQFLDVSANNYINYGTVNENNDFGITFIQTENSLIAKNGNNVLLTVEIFYNNGERQLVKYVYGE